MATSVDTSVALVINKVPSTSVLNTITPIANELYLVPKAATQTQIYSVGTTAPSNTNLFWVDTTSGTPLLKFYDGTAWVNIGSIWS